MVLSSLTANPVSRRPAALVVGVLSVFFVLLAFVGNWEPNLATAHSHGQSNEADMGTNPATSSASLLPSAPSSVRLAILGDTGSGAPAQFAIRDQLLAVQKKTPLQGLLLVGDIIYPRGNYKQTGQQLYSQVYQPLWDQHLPFYPVLGNHDIINGFEPGILKFYRMPNRYYQTYFSADGVSVDCFGIDTNMPNDAAQKAWLNNALATSTAQWKLVYGHHPVYSSGAHGNNAELEAWLTPLFKQYNVQFYFSGHDHGYERFEPKHGTVHVVSGGGGAYLRGFSHVSSGSQVRLKTHEFMVLQLTPTGMDGVAVDTQGNVIDRFHHEHAALVSPRGHQ